MNRRNKMSIVFNRKKSNYMKLKIYCEIKRNCVLNAIVSGRKGHNQTLRWPFHSIDTIKHSRTSFVQTTTFLYLKTVASYGPQLETCKRWGEKNWLFDGVRVYEDEFCFTLLLVNNIAFVYVNLLKPTGHVMYQQFNILQLYVLPTLYLCVLYLSENKQRLVPLTA